MLEISLEKMREEIGRKISKDELPKINKKAPEIVRKALDFLTEATYLTISGVPPGIGYQKEIDWIIRRYGAKIQKLSGEIFDLIEQYKKLKEDDLAGSQDISEKLVPAVRKALEEYRKHKKIHQELKLFKF
ncbi:MAG: hypothetical protein QXP53_00295 [Candidatus Pacearchaeota archaeon]